MNHSDLRSRLRQVSGVAAGATAGYFAAGKVAAKAAAPFGPVAVICVTFGSVAGWVLATALTGGRQ